MSKDESFTDIIKERIAIICHAHPSISKGGAEIAAYTLFLGLTTLGSDAIFIAACTESDRDKLALGSANERAIFYDPLFYDHFYHLGLAGIVNELKEILTTENITIANFHHFMNLGVGAVRAVSALPGVITIVTLHEYLAICYHHGQMITHPAKVLCERATPQSCWACFPDRTRQQFALRKALFLDSFREVQGFVSPSRFLAQRYISWGLNAGAIAIVENGLANLPPKSPPLPHHEASQWVFGFFGQINPFKGVDIILKAADVISRSPSLANRIIIRIHGNFVGQPKSFVAQFQKAVKKYPFLSYAGPYENVSVGRLMADCDYVLVPSIWWENSPVVIQEAYAAGRPVICTGIGGMAEKVENGISGLQFRLGDYVDLASVLNRAADNNMFTQLSKAIPPAFDATGMARQYLEVFHQFLDVKDHDQLIENQSENASL